MCCANSRGAVSESAFIFWTGGACFLLQDASKHNHWMGTVSAWREEAPAALSEVLVTRATCLSTCLAWTCILQASPLSRGRLHMVQIQALV